MSEADGEVRRSGRATKGKHTRIDLEPHTPVPRKKKEKIDAPTEDEQAADGDGDGNEEVIRCVCGADTEDEDDSRMMVQCEKCLVWQHNICLGITKNKIPENYFCEQCRPDMHENFLRRVANGEKPWERGGRRKSRKSFGGVGRRGKGESEGASEAPPSVDSGTPRPRESSHAGAMDIDGRSPGPNNVISDGHIKAEQSNGRTGMDAMDVEKRPRSRESTVDANPDQATRQSRDSTEEMLPPTTPLRRDGDASKKRKSRDSNADLHIDTSHAQNHPTAVQTPNELKTPRRPSVTTPIGNPSTGKAPRNKKRRVSEGGAMSPTKAQAPLEDSRKKITNFLADNFATNIKKKPELKLTAEQTNPEAMIKLASEIEAAAFNALCSRGEVNEDYKSKFRSLTYNLGRNDELFEQIFNGTVTAEQLVNMKSEELANKELRKETDKLRHQNEVQHTLPSEFDSGPRIRRTHKGEEFVGDDESGQGYTSFKTALPEKKLETPTEEKGESGSPTIGPGETPTSAAPTPTHDTFAKPETKNGERTRKFSIEGVWNKIEPGDSVQHRSSFSHNLPLVSPRQPVPHMTPEMAKIDRDIDNLLSVEPEREGLGTPPYSPAPEDALDSAEWKGRVNMHPTADFDAVIRLVAGSNLGRDSNWLSLLGTSVIIDGRIAIERASEYLAGQRYSRSNVLSVLAISPREMIGGSVEFKKLFDYFKHKNRYGVIGHHVIPAVRDIYLVPVDRDEPLPVFFETIEPSVIPEVPRTDRMLLLVYVVVRDQLKTAIPPAIGSKRENSISQHGTPMNHGYQGSPIQHTPIHQTPQAYEQSPSQRAATYAQTQPVHQQSAQPVQHGPDGMPFPPLPRTTKTFNFNAWPELQNSLPYLEDVQIDCINRIVEKYPEAANNPQLLSDLLVHESSKST